ncbi:zinc finger protein 62-like [Coccinella septempunctata]|uniref:zinc finger protein 62-like n=1 Tax=Coccinella septempunctata TaxID=41139 RepID=UPI001D09146C|nr:zinc finger protein 62-like [Coccinella septempunctata]XP_044747271.1 zinc finger protein 62-like [Coccinella septempunctata]
MKTENCIPGDPVWTNSVGILPNDECLPVIGGCQVSSILSTLDSPNKSVMNHSEISQTMDIIILENSDLKLSTNDLNLQQTNNYMILKDKIEQKNNGNIKNAINYKNEFHNQQSKNYMILKDKIEQKNNGILKSSINNRNESTNLEDLLYFVCNLCPFLCTSNEKIADHLKNAHSNKTNRKQLHLKCPACQNIFYHKISLRSHLIHDHGVSNSDINKIIQAVVYYAKVKMKVNEKKSNKSKHKSSMKLDKSTVQSQLKVEDQNICPSDHHILESGKSNSTLTNLSLDASNGLSISNSDVNNKNNKKERNSTMNGKHVNSNNLISNLVENKKEHICLFPLCRVRMKDPNKLQYHINCHTQTGFKCGECDQEFQLWNSLSGHLWRLHKIDMELFCCSECDYKTFSLAKLNNVHKLIHTDMKNFICNICQKGFKNNKQLRNHKVIHKEKSDKHLHACDICSRNFSDRRQVKLHKDTVHNKLKPFLCNFCGYKSSSRSSLKIHIRQHTGEKPFSCDSCSYSTADHNSLRRHKLRHTGDKPYKCAYCPYACIQSSTYKVHLKTKHPGLEKDLMFTCHECQYRSVNKDMYLAHMSMSHNQQIT